MAITVRNIPDELLVEILGKLPKKDLKNARLACTLWSTAGAKVMFQQVYCAPRKVVMETFTEIAANPAFALNVKELIYDGRLLLPEFGNRASYWAAFCARMVKEIDIYEDHTRNAKGDVDSDFAHQVYQDSIWNVEKLGASEDMKNIVANDCEKFYFNVADSFERYEPLLDQQERILKGGTDFKALCEGLTFFRNIEKMKHKISAIIILDLNLNLASLYLESDGVACVKEGDLMSIIRAHKGSLREVSMAGISLPGKGRWKHFGKAMGQILELRYLRVSGLYDESAAYLGGPQWLPSEQNLAFVHDMMQWALPNLLEIGNHNWRITGRLKAGSQ